MYLYLSLLDNLGFFHISVSVRPVVEGNYVGGDGIWGFDLEAYTLDCFFFVK